MAIIRIRSDQIIDFINIEGNIFRPDNIKFRILTDRIGEFPDITQRLHFCQIDETAQKRLLVEMICKKMHRETYDNPQISTEQT